ncbi:MAG: hypothetical protein IKQ20_06330, partial [Bacteroidales bacterium]|nr:hypothetical protein [Bacteroidales bacterium]
MKKFAMLIALAVVAVGCVLGADAQLDVPEGVSLAIAPLATQKAVFLNSLKEEYEKIDTWLANAEDLSAFVPDGQTIKFPEGGADPAVYKNRTTDVDSVEPTETVYSEDLDVYDSQNYKIRNIYLHALPFNKVQFYTRKSADSIVKKEIADAAYAFAPTQAGTKSIVMATTGDAANGFKMLTLADVLTLACQADRMQMPEGNRNLVLPSDWWWDLVSNNEILKGQLKYQQNTGTIDPKIVNYYGINIHKSLGDKLGLGYDTNTSKKAAQGAAITGTVCPAALFFCGQEVYRAGGQFEMFYKDKSVNTDGRAYEFGFQH